tara:strand:+ start:284 stop:610 length:327 start_codon:yes stop_codon:yes gene_type:complete
MARTGYSQTVGTRAQVWHGTAKKTSGGLTKKDLMMKNGRIKSRRASQKAKRNNNLKKAGWTFKRGTFGAVRIGEERKGRKGRSKGSRKRRSGSRKRGRRSGSSRRRRR